MQADFKHRFCSQSNFMYTNSIAKQQRMLDIIDRLLNNEEVHRNELLKLREHVVRSDEKKQVQNSLSKLPNDESEAVKQALGLEEIRNKKINVQSLPRGTTPMRIFSIRTRTLLLSASRDWMFDVFKMDKEVPNRAMSTVMPWFAQDAEFYDILNVDPARFQWFSRRMEDSYRAVPYHNRNHACSVLVSLHHILITGKGIEIVPIDRRAITLLACYLAAVGHDSEHPGLTNEFLIKTKAAPALTHHDQSPNENYHISKTLALISDSQLLHSFDEDARQYIRTIIINLILATDMKNHFTILEALEKVERGDEDKNFMIFLQFFIKCADLNHMTLSSPVHKKWVSKLEEEFYAQGDIEKSMGLVVSPLMDRTRPGLSVSQTGFFRAIALPLFERLCDILPDTSAMLEGARHNMMIESEDK